MCNIYTIEDLYSLGKSLATKMNVKNNIRDDFIQEFVIAGWNAGIKGDESRAIRSYQYSLGRFAAMELFHEKNKDDVSIDANPECVSYIPDCFDLIEDICTKEHVELIKHAINTLTDKQRKTIIHWLETDGNISATSREMKCSDETSRKVIIEIFQILRGREPNVKHKLYPVDVFTQIECEQCGRVSDINLHLLMRNGNTFKKICPKCSSKKVHPLKNRKCTICGVTLSQSNYKPICHCCYDIIVNND